MPEFEKPVIDATVFMAMHDEEDQKRDKAVKFFSANFQIGAEISLDQVGLCDAVIWKKPREVQDRYYPFMDVLHTIMPIKRFAYNREVIEFACGRGLFNILSVPAACLAAYVIIGNRTLFTLDSSLLELGALDGHIGDFDFRNNSSEQWVFSSDLDLLYRESLCLSVTTDEVFNAA